MNNMTELYPENKKIVLLGTFPPPLGGVSVFLYRLYKSLSSKGFNVFKWDISCGRVNYYKDFLKYFVKFFFSSKYLLHINSLSKRNVKVGLMLKRFTGVELFVTCHNVTSIESSAGYTDLLFKLIEVSDKFICVSQAVANKFLEKGVRKEEKLVIQNAFIPPPIEEEEKIWLSYSKATKDFISTKNPLLVANAFKLVIHHGVDLYGLDLCIDLIDLLRKDYPNIGLIFALANKEENREYLKKMQIKISDMKIKDNFHFITDQKELWPIFKKSDIFIRPTSSDGYGISIDEALYFNCSAVASDVCERNKNAVLFESRNLDDLLVKCRQILQKK